MKATKMVIVPMAAACVLTAVASEWYGGDDSGQAQNGNWSSTGRPGWSPSVPNGSGAVAFFGESSPKCTVFQDVSGGVTIGSLVLDTTRANDLQVKEATNASNPYPPVIFDEDGSGPGFAVISNNATRVRIQIGSKVPVVLQDDLLLVNANPGIHTRSFAISITSNISGSGDVTFDNCLDEPANGPIVLSSSTSDFIGNVLIRRGCAKAVYAKAFGATSNVVTLGAEGYGDATLCFEGSGLTFTYPIVVSQVTSGRLRIHGESLSADPGKNCAVTLTGPIELRGDVVFDIPAKPYAGADWTFQQTVNAVISGAGGLAKENDGPLVFKKANTYAGGTKVGGGRLVVEANAALGSGNVEVAPGAVLELLGSSAIDDAANLDIGVEGTDTGVVSVPDGATEVVGSVSVGGKLVAKGTYAALDSTAGGSVVKVAWVSGRGLLKTLGGKPGMFVIIR